MQENIELHRSVQELKVKIEEVTYISKNASSNLEEYRRKSDEEERVNWGWIVMLE